MKDYNPANWYWRVGGDLTKVFSSASGSYVPTGDAAFAAWTADETAPTNIDTEANLGAVLAPYLIRPTHAGVLDGYQTAQTDHVAVKLMFKLLFVLMNRVNVLEGKPQITAAQARAYVKSQM